jgi:hypothetical protein
MKQINSLPDLAFPAEYVSARARKQNPKHMTCVLVVQNTTYSKTYSRDCARFYADSRRVPNAAAFPTPSGVDFDDFDDERFRRVVSTSPSLVFVLGQKGIVVVERER